VIAGGQPQSHTRECWGKWAPLVSAVVSTLDRENANLLHLPAPGGLFDQPARTMAFIEIVRAEFSERLRQEFKAKAGK